MQEEKKEIKPESLGKVVLLLGGMSSEREVSLMSGKGVYDALVEAGVDVTRFDPKEQSISELEKGAFDRAILPCTAAMVKMERFKVFWNI